MDKHIEPAVFTVKQAAEYLSCNPKTVRDFCRQGKIHAIKLGSKWRIPKETLKDFINGKDN